jgi:ribosomal protein S11
MVLLVVGIAACSDNSNNTVIPIQSIPGDYVLKTINGSPLPFTFGDGITLNTDILSLHDNGTFIETMSLADGRVVVDTGVYTSNNNFLTITDETAGFTYSASLTGSVLTAVFPTGLTEVFQKK